LNFRLIHQHQAWDCRVSGYGLRIVISPTVADMMIFLRENPTPMPALAIHQFGMQQF
jgi:hypothetical protein